MGRIQQQLQRYDMQLKGQLIHACLLLNLKQKYSLPTPLTKNKTKTQEQCLLTTSRSYFTWPLHGIIFRLLSLYKFPICFYQAFLTNVTQYFFKATSQENANILIRELSEQYISDFTPSPEGKKMQKKDSSVRLPKWWWLIKTPSINTNCFYYYTRGKRRISSFLNGNYQLKHKSPSFLYKLC